MNNFEAKYIHIASGYLNEKLEKLHILHEEKKESKEVKSELSPLKKLVSTLFSRT